MNVEVPRKIVLMYWEETTPMHWRYLEIIPSVHFQSMGILHPCTSILRRINICGYGSISCLTSVWILVPLSYKKIPSLSGILFFDYFLGLLGSELINKILRWIYGGFDCFSCGFCVLSITGIDVAYMYICICMRKYSSLSHIFMFTFLFIVT